MPDQRRPIPVDYETPRDPGATAPLTSVGLTVWLATMVGLITIVATLIIPRFEQIFKDFKMPLPVLTRLLLSFARWCSNGYGWVLLWLVPIVVPVVVTRATYRAGVGADQRRAGQRVIRVICLLITAGILVTIVLGLFLPMIHLVQTVSNPKP